MQVHTLDWNQYKNCLTFSVNFLKSSFLSLQQGLSHLVGKYTNVLNNTVVITIKIILVDEATILNTPSRK